MIKFFIIANRHSQIRLAQYYGERPSLEERQKLETQIIHQCLSRSDNMSFTFDFNNMKIVYKLFNSIFCIAGIDNDSNELEILSFFDFYLNILHDFYGEINETSIIYNETQSYAALNEIILDGEIVEVSKSQILKTLRDFFQ